MSQDNLPRFTRSSAQRSASRSSLPPGGVDDTQRSLSPPALLRRGEPRSTPSHRTTRPEELTGGPQFTTPRSTNVTPMTAAIVPRPIPPQDENRFGDLAATTVDESEPEDATDDATTLSDSLISPGADNVVTYPDTPTLNRDLDSCMVDISTDLATVPDREQSAQFTSLRQDLRTDILAIFQQCLTDLDTRIDTRLRSLFEKDIRQNVRETVTTSVATVQETVTKELTNIVTAEIDVKIGSVLDLDAKLVSFRDDITGRLDDMSAAITKLTKDVHANTSSLGDVTKTKIPNLERRVAGIYTGDDPQPTASPDDMPTPPPPSTPTDPPPDLLPPTRGATSFRPSNSRPPAPTNVDTHQYRTPSVDFQLHNSHFGAGIDADGPTLSPNERSRSAYRNFQANNPELRQPRPDIPAASNSRPDDSYPDVTRSAPRQNRITPGPIASPRNRDRDSRARELGANRSDISALATAGYHCGIDGGVDPLTSITLVDVGYTNIGSDDVVACHNAIIEVHRKVLQMWHNPTTNTFGPQVNRIIQKSLKLFPVLDSTSTSDMVDFYDRLQETAADHLIALMPFDAILLRFGFEGLCVPGLGVTKYARMGKALMELLPRLIPGSLSPQVNAALYSVRYESNNGYDYLWRILELAVPGFDPIVTVQLPVWADCGDIFHFAQEYILYFRLQSKLNFHYDDRTQSGIFLRAIQHTDFADTVTTLQTQVNTFREFDEGYLPNHLRLHGLATSIHQNSMSRHRDIANPRVRRIDGGPPMVQGLPRIFRFERQRGDDRRSGYGHRGGDGSERDRGAGTPGGFDARPPRDRDRPRRPRGQLSNPDRNRRPFLADVQCDACKRVGHVAKHCDMLATAICIERYMKKVLSPSARDAIESDWLTRWKEKLGNPTSTPRQVLRAYVENLDITVAHLDDEMDWDVWEDEDFPDDAHESSSN